MPSDPFDAMLTEEAVRRIAGDTYFQRGLAYFKRGRVSELEDLSDAVHATVSGTQDYMVRLRAKGKYLDFSCDCPLGQDEAFCKHCVATALAWLSARANGSIARPTGGVHKLSGQEVGDTEIVQALEAEDKATLIRWMLDWSVGNQALRERLELVASGEQAAEALVAALKGTLEKAIRIRGFVDYREMGGYAGGVHSELDSVERFIEQGQAAAMIGLCESVMRWIAKAAEKCDDSDGGIMELLGRVGDLHLQACEVAKPDPVALAKRLFAAEMRSDFSEWHDAAERYAHVLGEPGLQAFRRLTEAEWARVPVRTKPTPYSSAENYYRITAMMESLARQSGDVEQLVAVLSRNLTHARQYERIADAYRDAGKHDEALEWAERGMALYEGMHGEALRLFVAEEYQRRERHADAVRMIFVEFRNQPTLTHYQTLERFARKANDWDDWRAQALAHLRRKLAGPPPAHERFGKRDHSPLVEIFLYEGRPAEAWQEAVAGGCNDTLWLQLADHRAKTHPDDAIPIYWRLAEKAILHASSSRYEPGVALLERAAPLMHALGRSAQFQQELEALRIRYKLKRNLLKLIETRKRFLYLG